MTYKIESVTISDAPDLAHTMMSAMYEDPHWSVLWGSMALQNIIDDCAERLPWNLTSHRSTKRHQKVIHAATGEIVGYARWIVPESHDSTLWAEAQVAEATPKELDDYKAAFNAVTIQGRFRGMNYKMAHVLGPALKRAEEEVMTDGPYLYLDYLTTAPMHQRKGIGTMLVKSGLAKADAASLKTIVMSTPAGVSLYESQGFVTKKIVVQDDAEFGGPGPHMQTFLVREPVVKSCNGNEIITPA